MNEGTGNGEPNHPEKTSDEGEKTARLITEVNDALSPSLTRETAENNPVVTVEPERLHSGVWGHTEGDISQSYSADKYGETGKIRFPFYHETRPYVAMSLSGSSFHMEAKAYPLIHPDDFSAENRPYSYTGKQLNYKGKVYLFGEAVIFRQRPLQLDEKMEVLRRKFAYGGLFAAEAKTYDNFLKSIKIDEKDTELVKGICLELRKGMPQSQRELRQWLEGAEPPETSYKQGLLF